MTDGQYVQTAQDRLPEFHKMCYSGQHIVVKYLEKSEYSTQMNLKSRMMCCVCCMRRDNSARWHLDTSR